MVNSLFIQKQHIVKLLIYKEYEYGSTCMNFHTYVAKIFKTDMFFIEQYVLQKNTTIICFNHGLM